MGKREGGRSVPAVGHIPRETVGGMENPKAFPTLCRSSLSTLKTVLRE